jgi:hypothetical protein
MEETDAYFDWKDSLAVESSILENHLKFDLAKYYFIRDPPDFVKAFHHFSSIDKKYSEEFENLGNFISASRGMISDVVQDEKVDAKLELKMCLNNFFKDDGCGLFFVSSFDSCLTSLTAKEVKNVLSEYNKNSIAYRAVSLLLCSKVQGLSEIIDVKMPVYPDDESMNESTNGEEGEIIEDEDEEEEMDEESLESQLINSTCKETILDLSTRVLKPYNEINNRWKVPNILLNALKTVNTNLKFIICNILCKANELRCHGMFTESRELFLAVMESYSTQVPQLNEWIPYEILLTQVQDNLSITDADEGILQKCANFLPFDKMLLEFHKQFPHLICRLLLRHSHPVLMNMDYTGKEAVIRVSSTIYRIIEGDTSVKTCKDFWDAVYEMVLSCCSVVRETPHEKKKHRKGQLRRPAKSKEQQETRMEEGVESLNQLLHNLPSHTHRALILSCLIKIYNLVRDKSVNQLTMPTIPFPVQWPSSLSAVQATPSLDVLSSVTHSFLEKNIKSDPNELEWIQAHGELSLLDSNYKNAMKSFLTILSFKTDCFTNFSSSTAEEETIEKMIFLSNKLSCHTESAVLQSMLVKPNYALAFKSLSEKSCSDSCHDLIPCLSDVTLLEFLVNLNERRGDTERKSQAIQLINQLELNNNNPVDILSEAANVRKRKFFHIMLKKYM